MAGRFYRILIKGLVQGVGFRPYVYRTAKEHGLSGFVKNTGSGVEIVVNDKNFVMKMNDLPPLAKISNYAVEDFLPENVSDDFKNDFNNDFKILSSFDDGGETELPPDLFLCNDCLNELNNKKDRRHKYYFITCTNCGPRFSIIEGYPYDRPLTSMKKFEMCPLCRKEYADPMDRRYHAQTVACKDCGPKLKLLDSDERDLAGKRLNEKRLSGKRLSGKNLAGNKFKDISGKSDDATVSATANLLKSGNFVSIKGVGGFHICSLTDEPSVQKVRSFLGRPHKPFAIMAKDISMIKRFAVLTDEEEAMLCSPARPIVVLKKKDSKAMRIVSELDSIGVMLPYTALHYLLFDYLNEPIVMTSCNLPGEPVLKSELSELYGRYFLSHEREIVNRCDDSVIKFVGSHPLFLRRSRGFVPLSVPLPVKCIDTLALGSEISNVVCAAKKDRCFLSQYIGNTSKLKTQEFMNEVVDRLIGLTRLKPALIVSDLHPGYYSTLLGKALAESIGVKLIAVQHHKAHVASVAAEHNLLDYVGIAMDGLGYGEDGKLWGGEVFDVRKGFIFQRVGSLEEQPQLGGDAATIFPKKMLFGILSKFLSEKELLATKLFDEKEAKLYIKQLSEEFNVPYTTSAGRVLDATAALLGLCDERTYDGRPAMLLESFADGAMPFDIKPVIEKKDGRLMLMTTPLFRFLVDNTKNNWKDRARLAATAQAYLAQGMLEIARFAANKNKKNRKLIVFSGGVAYNSMMSGIMIKEGVLVNKDIPCGDGGICYGQAYLAGFASKSNNII